MKRMATQAMTSTEPPDWSGIEEDIHCPLCDYDLRGLSEPRCPECGYRFAWEEVLDPDRRLHPYLFEHHPQRNVRSFCQTIVGGLWPGRFWRRLRPGQPSRWSRLVVYGMIAMGVYLVLAETHIGAFPGLIYWKIDGNRRSQPWMVSRLPKSEIPRIISQYGSLQNYAESLAPTHVNRLLLVQAWDEGQFRSPGLWLPAWLLGSLGTLLVFRVSMRRARIRWVHVLRCVVYSFDAFVWVGLVGLLADTAWSSNYLPHTVYNMVQRVLDWIVVATTLAVVYRMVAAYRLYLRFDHALATVLASQMICALGAVVAVQYGLLHLQAVRQVWQWVLLWKAWG